MYLLYSGQFRGIDLLGIFLDTETTGLDWSRHSIFEIAFCLVDLCSGEKLDEYISLIQLTEEEWEKSDPKSIKYTGIKWKTLQKEGKKVEVVQKEIVEIFKKWDVVRKKAVFICQNPSFDRIHFSNLLPIENQESLELPYIWLDLASMHWAKLAGVKESFDSINLSKDAIADYYKLPPEKMPHRACRGVEHLILCYEKVVGFPSAKK